MNSEKSSILTGKRFVVSINPEDRVLKETLINKIMKMDGDICHNASKSTVHYIVVDPNNIYITPTHWSQSGYGMSENNMCIWVKPEFIYKVEEVQSIIMKPGLNKFIVNNITELYKNNNTFNVTRFVNRKINRKRKRTEYLTNTGDILTIRTRYKLNEYTHTINLNHCKTLSDIILEIQKPWKNNIEYINNNDLEIIPQISIGSTLFK